MVTWLRYVYNSAVVEVTMTIVAALGSFIVGNEMLGVSGVLAVLCLGIWMLSFGAHHISREVQEPLNIIWYAACIFSVLPNHAVLHRSSRFHKMHGSSTSV